MNPLRPAILAAAKSGRLKKTLTKSPGTKQIVRRFIAGETRADVLPVVRALLDSGRLISIDHLGEDTTDPAQAEATTNEYLALISDLAALGTSKPGALEVSLKLSALGQALPAGADPRSLRSIADGEAIAVAHARTICAAAQEAGVLVTVDMEDHTTTDSTLSIVGKLRADFPWVGAVLQSYLHRTEADCRALAGPGSRIRLCKGAYREPESVAFQRAADVDASYLRCLDVLMSGEGFPMVASHDPAIIAAAEDAGRSPERFEHQMLYGIRDLEQQRLVEAGYAMRVYVPYGSQWYGYFMRRLAERPANLTFFLRSLVTKS